ncbi:MAG: hypothetical protein Q7S47_00640 [bacterium]|nr:hypothetical protein [bacterium]
MSQLQPQSNRLKTVSLPRGEYERLKDIEKRFERMRDIAVHDFFVSPNTRNAKDILDGLKKSKRYNVAFLKSMKKGLEESDYFSK